MKQELFSLWQKYKCIKQLLVEIFAKEATILQIDAHAAILQIQTKSVENAAKMYKKK